MKRTIVPFPTEAGGLRVETPPLQDIAKPSDVRMVVSDVNGASLFSFGVGDDGKYHLYAIADAIILDA